MGHAVWNQRDDNGARPGGRSILLVQSEALHSGEKRGIGTAGLAPDGGRREKGSLSLPPTPHPSQSKPAFKPRKKTPPVCTPWPEV